MSKCECTNCVHESVCRIREFPSIEEILKDGCPHYKDKALFVELPCKIGDEIWGITEKNGKKIVEKSVVEEFHIFTSKNKMIIELDTTWLQLENIGEIAFLTKEEAERKLREVGE